MKIPMSLYLAAALALSIFGNGWQLYHAGGATSRCQTAVNAQAAGQDHAALTDQHRADVDNVHQQKLQAAKNNADESSDAGEVAGLQQLVATKDSTIQKLRDQLKEKPDAKHTPFDPLQCLDAPLPAALIGSLQQRPGGGAQPRR